MRRTPALALAMCFMALSLVSCGGDEVDDGPLTAAEYVERGDAICNEWRESIDKLENELGDSPEQSEIIEFTQEVGQIGGTNLAELMELNAPAEFAAQRAVLEQAFTAMAVMQQDFANGTNDGQQLTAASQSIDAALQDIWSGCQR